jgi:DedD protein
MTEKSAGASTNETTTEAPELRNQLIRRLAVAGGLVAVLLGMLAVFDHFSQPADEQEIRVFTEPVPVAPKKMVIQPVTPVDPPVDDAVTAQQADSENAAAAEPDTPIPDQAPPPPEVAAEPAIQTPARSEPARVRPRSPVPADANIVPEMTSSPPLLPPPVVQSEAPPKTAAPLAPSARVVEAKPAASAAPRLFSGFVLQAGVFASAQRAEELHAKLTLSGVPSSIETRVQVGPFRTRKEAAEAQQKLRELGIESILVAPRGGR